MAPSTNILLLIALIIGTVFSFPFEVHQEVHGLVRRDSENLVCGAVCAACIPEYGCTSPTKRSLCRRSLPWIETGNSSSRRLQKREFEIPHPDDVGEFVDELANTPTAVNLAPYIEDVGEPSFATLQRFEDYPDSRLVISMADDGLLTGCTMVTVVSARAVYMGHFWQNLGFVNYNRADPEPANFFRNVANLIQGRTPLFRAAGDALDPTLFNGPNDLPYAAIMTPRNNDAQQSLYYPGRVRQITAILQRMIPGVRVDVYPYWAKDPEDPDDPDPDFEPGEGRAVFEYDPNADGYNHPDWRLWYETSFEQGSLLGQPVQ